MSEKEKNEQTPAAEEHKNGKDGANEWKKVEAEPAEKKPETAVDPMEAKFDELTKKLAESEKQRLLALAEMDNQRKRTAKEKEALRASVETDTLFPFFQVFDHFSLAVAAAKSAQNLDSVLKGMEMIDAEFARAFQALGIEKIDAVGKEFDPKFHEAMAQEPSEKIPAGKVVRQWSAGFRSGDRLLKPAMVIVSSGKPEKTASPADGKNAKK